MNKSLNYAQKAILEEMRMYPCLGLVSKYHSGSHKDMNYWTFKKSYFVLGKMLKEISQKVTLINNFNDLKTLGYHYEQLMFKKTKNINTHKGLLFCLSIFWYAYLKVENKQNFIEIENFIKNFSQDLFLTDYQELNNRALEGNQEIKGARLAALTGYKIIFDVYNFYCDNLKTKKIPLKIKNFLLLLKIITLIDDTTAIRKVGVNTYKQFQKESSDLIDEILANPFNKEMMKKIMAFNKKAIAKNFSPGGAADLIVLVFFLINENN